MEPVYIVAISVGGVFLLFLGIYWLVNDYTEKKDEKRRRELENAYKPANLKKMEYDLAFYDEETAARIMGGNRAAADEQVTIDELVKSNSSAPNEKTQDAVLKKIGDEGVEEITGHYNPD